jgi:hypothetical protein
LEFNKEKKKHNDKDCKKCRNKNNKESDAKLKTMEKGQILELR